MSHTTSKSTPIISLEEIQKMQTNIHHLQSELDIMKGNYIKSNNIDEIKNYLEN